VLINLKSNSKEELCKEICSYIRYKEANSQDKYNNRMNAIFEGIGHTFLCTGWENISLYNTKTKTKSTTKLPKLLESNKVIQSADELFSFITDIRSENDQSKYGNQGLYFRMIDKHPTIDALCIEFDQILNVSFMRVE